VDKREQAERGVSCEEIIVAITVLPSDTLMACLKEHADDLGGQGINLFRNAVGGSKSNLLDSYIRPHLLRLGESYIYIAEDNGGKGSRPAYDPGNTFAATINSELAVPGRWGLFTNPLGWIDIDADGPRPSDRPINIGFCVYTHEFDNLRISEQLKVICDGGLKRTEAILCCFKDYRGCEVVYGGRKSLHFHFIFDLRHWSHDLAFASNSSYQENWLADFPDIYLREAHQDRWEFIADAFRHGTGIEAEPDPSLRFWEQNRRLPLALRLVRKDHPLGLPAGSYVPQYVLASTVRKTVPRGSSSWLHHANLIGSSAVRHVRRHAARKDLDPDRTSVTNSDRTPDERRVGTTLDRSAIEQGHFDKFLSANFPKLTMGSDIRYARVEFGRQGPKLHLFNNADDQTPSSIIQGDYTNVLLQGHHQFDGETYPLPVSPNQLYAAMVEQDTGQANPTDHFLDRIFAAEVNDRESYRRFLTDHIFAAMQAARLVLILGPEGCGKSHAVMASIGRIVGRGDRLTGIHFGYADEAVFISSPCYAQAAEKIRDFTAMYPDGPYVAFEYLSLTELYQRHCPAGDRISEINALDMGFSSWLRAVHDQQPEIYAMMLAHRDKLHAIRQRGQIPILFGVHETVRRHADTGMTRLFYARSFGERWFDQMTPDARRGYRAKLRFETPFAHVVLDEVSVSDLVSIHRAEDVRWARDFERSVEPIPEADKLARYRAFKTYRASNPSLHDGNDWSDKSDWTYVQEILHANYADDDLIQITSERCPFDDAQGMYGDCIGRFYYVAPRMWWSGIERTTLLTTESLPAQIINALAGRCARSGDEGPNPYRVFRFDQPGLFEDFVYVENHPDCKKQTLPRLVEAYVERFPGAVVISDMLKERIDDDVPVLTHLSARGSNELDKHDLIAFYTAPSIELFSQLAALDARLGTRNSIALWYVDRFNQTCGRNRGFRGQYGCRHIAVMAHRMYKWLAPYLVGWSRYAFPRQRCSAELGKIA
jgi:hypothetical protein